MATVLVVVAEVRVDELDEMLSAKDCNVVEQLSA
jgi:hypothetical protein